MKLKGNDIESLLLLDFFNGFPSDFSSVVLFGSCIEGVVLRDK